MPAFEDVAVKGPDVKGVATFWVKGGDASSLAAVGDVMAAKDVELGDATFEGDVVLIAVVLSDVD